MGACLSTQEGCAHVRPRLRRRAVIKRLESKRSRISGYHKVSKNVDDDDDDDSEELELDTHFTGKTSEAWLEPNPLYESESSSDDEYHSVPDMLLDEAEDSPFEFTLPKDDMKEEKSSNVHSYFSSSLMTAPKEMQSYSSATFFSKDVAHKSDSSGIGKNKVFVDDMSSMFH